MNKFEIKVTKFKISTNESEGLLLLIETNDQQLRNLNETKKTFMELKSRFKRYQGYDCEVFEIKNGTKSKLDPAAWK